jgi:hypothetical protein
VPRDREPPTGGRREGFLNNEIAKISKRKSVFITLPHSSNATLFEIFCELRFKSLFATYKIAKISERKFAFITSHILQMLPSLRSL